MNYAPRPLKLLLFDIDGTLMLSYGGGLRAMTEAACRVFCPGFSLATIDFNGRLDPEIVVEALATNGVEATHAQLEAFRQHYFRRLPSELSSARALPGVLDLLARLRKTEGVVLGLVTGNYTDSARLKLRAVGIDPDWFVIHGCGEVAETRPALVRWAMDAASDLAGRAVRPADTIVLGDTPRDVDCAKANGCLAVAVATGQFSVDILRCTAADLVLSDFRDPAVLLEMLDWPRPSASGVI
ncbi:MAG: HAD family hydrolase [Pirellulales bacterium]|nr:HAD family hydrolase [Pirellulales bacterium]